MSTVRLALILGALTAFTPLSVDMYLPALPSLARQFQASHGAVQLTLSSFFAGIALGQLFYGPICDRYGRKPPLYVGGVLFVLASCGCALAGDVQSLVAMRFVQAIGCCAGMVMPRAMVRDLFEPQQAARMFSMLMLVMGVAPILAPLIGGYVLLWFGWRAIFWGLAVYAALAIVAGHSLPETHRPREPVTLSIGSALRGYAAVLADRQFMGYALAGALPIAGMFAYIAGSPFVFIELYGVPVEQFGWLFGANAAGFIAASQINARLLRHYAASRILGVASWACAAAGVLLLAMALSGWGGLAGIAVPLFLCLAPMGMVFPNASACALAGHGARAGTASAMLGILQFGGGGLTSAAIGAIPATSALPIGLIIAACMVGAAVARQALVSRE